MIDNLLPPVFKDEIFDQSCIEHKYKNIIINIFQSNGYELVKTPLIEYENLTNGVVAIHTGKKPKSYEWLSKAYTNNTYFLKS